MAAPASVGERDALWIVYSVELVLGFAKRPNKQINLVRRVPKTPLGMSVSISVREQFK